MRYLLLTAVIAAAMMATACQAQKMTPEDLRARCVSNVTATCFPDNSQQVCSQYVQIATGQYESAKQCRQACQNEGHKVAISGPDIMECKRFFDSAIDLCSQYCDSNYP